MSEQVQGDRDFEWASNFYLYESLPTNWSDMEEEELFTLIQSIAWQPFEYWEGEDIYNEIEKLSSSVRTYINKEKK